MTFRGLSDRQDKGNDGFALIVVIAFLLIFSSFLGVFAMSAHIKALTGATRLSDFRLQSVANAITAMIAYKISTQSSGNADFAGFAHCRVGGFDVDIGVQPHSGLISLNLAGEETLMVGFDALGIANSDQKTLARAVAQFRYPSGLSDEASLPSLPNGYKYGPFEDIMELTDFKPLEDIPAWKLARVFSVYGSLATPSSATISPLLRSSRGAGLQEIAAQLTRAPAGMTVTIEATVQEGGRRYYVGDVFDIGGTSMIRQIATVPWDHLSTPPTGPNNPGLCAAAFDPKDIRLLNSAMQ